MGDVKPRRFWIVVLSTATLLLFSGAYPAQRRPVLLLHIFAKEPTYHSSRGRRMSLTFPSYRTGVSTQNPPTLLPRFFAFFSARIFHAVRSAPLSTSSLAAASRIWVCPIFPNPPAIGKKISGASSTNADCCSGVSIRFP